MWHRPTCQVVISLLPKHPCLGHMPRHEPRDIVFDLDIKQNLESVSNNHVDNRYFRQKQPPLSIWGVNSVFLWSTEKPRVSMVTDHSDTDPAVCHVWTICSIIIHRAAKNPIIWHRHLAKNIIEWRQNTVEGEKKNAQKHMVLCRRFFFFFSCSFVIMLSFLLTCLIYHYITSCLIRIIMTFEC